MLDRLTGMNVLAKVAALGSLSAAARALGMSQTMATKHMAALEERLGTRLLHRSTRRVTLTEAGRTYLDAVLRVLAEVEEADAAASATAVDVKGSMRVNAPVSFGVREIAPLIPAFAAQYPLLTIELGLNDRRVDPLEEGWDLVIRIGPMPDSSLVARKLASAATVLIAARSYLDLRGRPATIGDLENHNCLCYTLSEATGGVGRWYFGARGAQSVAIKGNLIASNGEALVAAAVAGQGIAYVPAFLAWPDLAAGRVVALELDHPARPLDGIHAVMPAGRRPPVKVRAFVDHVARHIARAPWQDEPRQFIAGT